MSRNRGMIKLLMAGGLAVGCGVAGVVSLLGGSTFQTVAFADVPSRSDRIEVYGRLDKQSITSLKGAVMVRFDILEEETKNNKPTLTGKRLTVLYDNPALGLAGNFPGASHAKCTGTYDPVAKQFVSDRIATKCPSKYEEQNVDLGTESAIDKWHKAIGFKEKKTGDVKTGDVKAGEAKASSY